MNEAVQLIRAQHGYDNFSVRHDNELSFGGCDASLGDTSYIVL